MARLARNQLTHYRFHHWRTHPVSQKADTVATTDRWQIEILIESHCAFQLGDLKHPHFKS
jgi:hypothetical protein